MLTLPRSLLPLKVEPPLCLCSLRALTPRLRLALEPSEDARALRCGPGQLGLLLFPLQRRALAKVTADLNSAVPRKKCLVLSYLHFSAAFGEGTTPFSISPLGFPDTSLISCQPISRLMLDLPPLFWSYSRLCFSSNLVSELPTSKIPRPAMVEQD